MQLTVGIIKKSEVNKYYIEDFDSLSFNDSKIFWHDKAYTDFLNLLDMSERSYEKKLSEFGAKYDFMSERYLFDTYKEAKNAIEWLEQMIVMNKLVMAGKCV